MTTSLIPAAPVSPPRQRLIADMTMRRFSAATQRNDLRVAYNACRNRHCPRCRGAAARDWLAERKADLLPVGYFHVVFTLPA